MRSEIEKGVIKLDLKNYFSRESPERISSQSRPIIISRITKRLHAGIAPNFRFHQCGLVICMVRGGEQAQRAVTIGSGVSLSLIRPSTRTIAFNML